MNLSVQKLEIQSQKLALDILSEEADIDLTLDIDNLIIGEP